MQIIPDDPIIASMERTGWPWWMNEQEEEDDADTEQPFAVYDP